MEINNEEFLQAFGKNLRKLRKERKLTQANLAFDAGISDSQIMRIEQGKHNFTIFTVLALSKALEVKPATLLNF